MKTELKLKYKKQVTVQPSTMTKTHTV